MNVKAHHVVVGGMLILAGGLVYLASKGTPQQLGLTKYVEMHLGPLQEHLVSTDELNMSRNFTAPKWPMLYPGTVAGGITSLIANGFTPLWQVPDAQAAGLPAEQAW